MKWILSLIKMAVQTAMICVISLATTWYTVHLYVDDVLKQFHISTPEHKLQLSKMISLFTLQAGQGLSGGKSASEQEKETSANEVPQTTSPADDSLYSDHHDDTLAEQPSLPAWSQVKGNSLLMTTDEFLTRKDALTDEEKWRIFEIVLKLPEEEMIRLSEMIEDGITEKELEEMDQIFSMYIKADEYEEIMRIVGKY